MASTIAVYAGLLGLLSHVTWFIHGEHDMESRKYVVAWTTTQAAAFFCLTRLAGESIKAAVAIQATASAAFVGALLASMVVYRVFFHQLRKFPGPFGWNITKLAHMRTNLDARGYVHLDDLHKRYGKYVRIGPTELSISDPAAVPLVLGPGSKCRKAAWYDTGLPLISLHQCRDVKLHEKRRRIWDKGFNAKSLRNYESRVTKYTDMLMSNLEKAAGKPLNASKWFNYYSFDVMGDLAFGESFHMLENNKTHSAIDLLGAGLSFMHIIPVVPWFFYMLSAIPGAAKEYHEFIAWSDDQAEKRKKMKPAEPDIMSHLLDGELMSNVEEVNRGWQMGDARLIIVAGSDTTAATLSYAVYELIKNPECVPKLRKEVASVGNDHLALAKCDYLNAVIDETLRLHPAVPAGLIRIAPPEGLNIGEQFIPGGTIMTLPSWTIHRSPDAFVRPYEFIPERWTEKPDMLKDRNGWVPFSSGPMGCIGKQLAYMELRAVLAGLIARFDLSFAEGEDGSALLEKTKDYFTLNLADMNIVCTPVA